VSGYFEFRILSDQDGLDGFLGSDRVMPPLNRPSVSLLDQNLLGHFAEQPIVVKAKKIKPSKYLAVHLRFEMDMTAYSVSILVGTTRKKMS
jgi:hypothetical protein